MSEERCKDCGLPSGHPPSYCVGALMVQLESAMLIVTAARDLVTRWRRDSIGGERANVLERKLQQAVETKYGRKT